MKKTANGTDIMNICGVDCYEKDGVAYLRLEAVARGLGFTRIAESGNEVIRWERVKKYLAEFCVPTNGHGEIPDFIPENVFYRLAMKAKNETAEKFQAKVADEIIPSIRKYGGYNADRATAELVRQQAEFMRQQIEFNRKIMERMEAIEAKPKRTSLIEVNPYGSPLYTNVDRRLKELNKKVQRVCDLYHKEWNQNLHMIYRTLEDKLGISLSSYLSVYQSEFGNEDACIMHVLAAYPTLNEVVNDLLDFAISKKEIYG